MLKEKGYEEFLAERIRQGREEIQAGKGYTLEQSKARTRQIIESKTKEYAEFEQEIRAYA